jgi:hypothetical protein
MALHECSNCGHAGRRLDYTSAYAWVDYYRCDDCGQTWCCAKHLPNRVLQIIAPPEQAYRRSVKHPLTARWR